MARITIKGAGHKWVGLAKQKLMQLEALRAETGTPLLTRIYRYAQANTMIRIVAFDPAIAVHGVIDIRVSAGGLWLTPYMSYSASYSDYYALVRLEDGGISGGHWYVSYSNFPDVGGYLFTYDIEDGVFYAPAYEDGTTRTGHICKQAGFDDLPSGSFINLSSYLEFDLSKDFPAAVGTIVSIAVHRGLVYALIRSDYVGVEGYVICLNGDGEVWRTYLPTADINPTRIDVDDFGIVAAGYGTSGDPSRLFFYSLDGTLTNNLALDSFLSAYEVDIFESVSLISESIVEVTGYAPGAYPPDYRRILIDRETLLPTSAEDEAVFYIPSTYGRPVSSRGIGSIACWEDTDDYARIWDLDVDAARTIRSTIPIPIASGYGHLEARIGRDYRISNEQENIGEIKP